jgi:glycosyltransferase involved in cell wall biosynthesis
MRILAFVEYLPPKLGSDRRVFEIMKRLSAKHEVHFVVFPAFRSLRNLTAQSERQVATCLANKEEAFSCEGVHGHPIKVTPLVAGLWQHSLILAYLATTISVFLKSSKILRKVNPDVVFLNYPSPYTGLIGFLEGKLSRKRVVVDFNDLIAQYSSNLLHIERTSIVTKIMILVQRFIVRNSDRMIAPTSYIRKYAASLGVSEQKMTVIPNGADTKMFDLKRSDPAKVRKDLNLPNAKLCVYSGRLDGWAGMQIILRLCSIARTKKPDLRFLLVGSGDNEKIQGENILCLGEMPHEKIPTVLATADLILIPFPNDDVSHAASPLKLFEAMSMCKPIVASRVSGIQDVIRDGENGFLADPDDPNDWMLKVETVLNSGELAARIAANAKRTVKERFDWDLLTRRCEEVLSASQSQVAPSPC